MERQEVKSFFAIIPLVACGFLFGTPFARASSCGSLIQVTLPGSLVSGGSGGSESSGSLPVTGGTNSGTLPDLIPNNSDVLNASKEKVETLHIGDKAYCRMQTKNVGTASAGSYESTCYLSEGDKIDDHPQYLGKEDTSSLGKGDTHTEYEDFTAPKYPGEYNVVWCTDSGKNVKELQEGNNCHIEDPFMVWSRPSIVARAVSLTGNPANLTPGQSFSADAEFFNAGENIGKTMLVGWYWDGVLSAVDHIQREHFEGGMTKIETWETGTAPSEPGQHELKVCANFDGRIENEQNPADDCLSIAVEVRSLPALVAVSVDFGGEEEIKEYEVFTPGFTVRNDGGMADSLIKIQYYLDDIPVGTDQIQPQNLPKGDTKREMLEKFSVATSGMHVFKGCVNDPYSITEDNTGDNCSEKSFVVELLWDPNAPGEVLWEHDGIVPLELSCGLIPNEPDFSQSPSIEAGDIGAVVFGSNHQRIFVPAEQAGNMAVGVWGNAPLAVTDISKWCWSSSQTGWGVNASTACGTPEPQGDGSFIVDLFDTPRASKGTWVVESGSAEYWLNPALWSTLPLDSDGHIRYGGWEPDRMELAVNAAGYFELIAKMGSFGMQGFWLPEGVSVTNQAFWHVTGGTIPGNPGSVFCDSNTGKLLIRIVGVAPGDTGRILLGTDAPWTFGWQISSQWILPPGASIVNQDGDYMIPFDESVRNPQLDATYTASLKRLTLTIPRKEYLSRAFWNAEDISELTDKAVFQVWIGSARFLPGTVTEDQSTGEVTIVFLGIESGEGGSVYLVKRDGSRSWQNLSVFRFGSGMIIDSSGGYVMP